MNIKFLSISALLGFSLAVAHASELPPSLGDRGDDLPDPSTCKPLRDFACGMKIHAGECRIMDRDITLTPRDCRGEEAAIHVEKDATLYLEPGVVFAIENAAESSDDGWYLIGIDVNGREAAVVGLSDPTNPLAKPARIEGFTLGLQFPYQRLLKENPQISQIEAFQRLVAGLTISDAELGIEMFAGLGDYIVDVRVTGTAGNPTSPPWAEERGILVQRLFLHEDWGLLKPETTQLDELIVEFVNGEGLVFEGYDYLGNGYVLPAGPIDPRSIDDLREYTSLVITLPIFYANTTGLELLISGWDMQDGTIASNGTGLMYFLEGLEDFLRGVEKPSIDSTVFVENGNGIIVRSELPSNTFDLASVPRLELTDVTSLGNSGMDIISATGQIGVDNVCANPLSVSDPELAELLLPCVRPR